MEDHITNLGTAAENAEGVSLLQQTHDEVSRASKTLFLAVPSWNERLYAEYKLLDPAVLGKMAKRAVRKMQQIGDNGSLTDIERAEPDMDLIARACVGLHIVRPDDGERVLIEDADGTAVTYSNIAHVLGVDEFITSNYQAVRYLFGQRNAEDRKSWVDNITAISLHANRISEWMRDPSKRGLDLASLLGEA